MLNVVERCVLNVVCCVYVVCCMLYVACCMLCVVCCVLYGCIAYSVLYVVYVVLCMYVWCVYSFHLLAAVLFHTMRLSDTMRLYDVNIFCFEHAGPS